MLPSTYYEEPSTARTSVRPRSSSSALRPPARPSAPARWDTARAPTYRKNACDHRSFVRSFISPRRALACRRPPSPSRPPARLNACLPGACLPAIFPSLSDPQHSHVARRAGGETNACAPPAPPPPTGPLSPPPPTSSPPPPPSGLSICSTCHPGCLPRYLGHCSAFLQRDVAQPNVVQSVGL